MGTPFSEFHVISATHGCSRRRSGAFIVNFEQILHLFLLFLLLTLNTQMIRG